MLLELLMEVQLSGCLPTPSSHPFLPIPPFPFNPSLPSFTHRHIFPYNKYTPTTDAQKQKDLQVL